MWRKVKVNVERHERREGRAGRREEKCVVKDEEEERKVQILSLFPPLPLSVICRRGRRDINMTLQLLS